MEVWLPALSLAYATGWDFRASLTRRPKTCQTPYIQTSFFGAFRVFRGSPISPSRQNPNRLIASKSPEKEGEKMVHNRWDQDQAIESIEPTSVPGQRLGEILDP